MSVRVRILGDDSDLQSKLDRSRKSLNKWGLAAMAAAKVAAGVLLNSSMQNIDSQAKLARGLDGTTKGLQALARAAGRAGVSNSELQSATLRLNQRLGQAITEGGKAGETLQKLGLDAGNLASMDVDDRMATIADSFKRLGMNSQETAFHLRNLGIRQAAIVNLMQEGGDAIRQSSDRIEQYGVALNDVDAAKVEAANDAMEEVKIVLSGVIDQLAIQLAPVIQGIADLFADAAIEAGGVGRFAEQAFNIIIKGAGVAGDALRGIQVIIKGGQLAFQALRVGAIEAFQMITRAWDFAANQIAEGLNHIIRGMNKIPKVDIEELTIGESAATRKLEEWGDSARQAMHEAQVDMHETLMRELPSTALDNWVEEVKAKSEEAAKAAVEARNRVGIEVPGVGGGLSDEEQQALNERLEKIRDTMRTEQELREKAHEQELEELRELRESGLQINEDWNEIERELKAKHEQELMDIKRRSEEEQTRIQEQAARERRQALSSALGDMTTLMNGNSRKMFEIGKAAALSQAVVDGKAAMVGAYKVGASQGGPALGAAYAAAAGAATFAQISSIRGQSFGSGGGASGSITQSVNDQSAPVQGGGGGQQQQSPTTIINLSGDSFGRSQVRDMLERINEERGDGSVMVRG